MQKLKIVSLMLMGMGAACAGGIVAALQVDYTLLREHEKWITSAFQAGIALVVFGCALGVLAGVVAHFDRKHPRPRLVREGDLIFDASLEKELRRRWACRQSPRRRQHGPKPAPH